MEDTILQRVNSIIENSDKTKNFVANEIGMSSTTVWRQLKGEQALSAKLVEGLLTVFPDVSAEWLLRGKGDMYEVNSYRNAPIPMAVSNPDVATDPVQAKESDGIWKAKYEAIKECYDSLLASLGGVIGKRNVG